MANDRLVHLELAGLPGVGKTTVTRALAERAPHRTSWLSAHHAWLRKLRLIWLFAPFVRLRFRRLFGKLEDADPQVRRSILYLLSTFFAERSLALLEARLTGRLLVLDEGFVQRGLGLWMRAPRAVRDAVWQDFLALAPSQLACIVLELDPAEAQRRALERDQGVSPAMANEEPGMESRESLAQRYEGLERLLQGEFPGQCVARLCVDADADPAQVADRIGVAVAEAFPERHPPSWLVFARVPDQDD